jgi:hypothetical protein
MANDFDQTTRSHAIWLFNHWSEVETFIKSLTVVDRFKSQKMNHPSTVKRAVEKSKKPAKEKEETPDKPIYTEEQFQAVCRERDGFKREVARLQKVDNEWTTQQPPVSKDDEQPGNDEQPSAPVEPQSDNAERGAACGLKLVSKDHLRDLEVGGIRLQFVEDASYGSIYVGEWEGFEVEFIVYADDNVAWFLDTIKTFATSLEEAVDNVKKATDYRLRNAIIDNERIFLIEQENGKFKGTFFLRRAEVIVGLSH